MSGNDRAPVVVVRNLRLAYYTRRGIYKALNGVDLEIYRGEVLGVAGESGCGKSTLGLTIMGLIPRNAAVTDGQVLVDGFDVVAPLREYFKKAKKFKADKNEDVLKRLHKKMMSIRGTKISMVFQEPMTTLNPVLPVGYQIAEVVLQHNPALLAKRRLARARATKDDVKTILGYLKSNDYDNLREFVKARGLEGLDDQAIAIWRRKDIHDIVKELRILNLCCQKISPMLAKPLEDVARTNRIPKTPIISSIVRRELIKEGYIKAAEFLGLLGMPEPEKVVKMYPHELSGGMRQRVVIATAMINSPELVILDEPTSALDVTIQAQILELLKELKEDIGSAFMFISHDLSVLYQVSDRVAIMYAGKVVEVGPKEAVFKEPKHPYTQMLLEAVPTIEPHELKGIKGEVPDLRNPPSGCMFHPRCPFAMPVCRSREPPTVDLGNGHRVACWLYAGGERQ
ncbi:Dipeptide/oligopeptide ABC transporter, ATPase component [Acidilobus saccharovorans 345-15]|uniref:Dipeptide/oligopeptide ABC transporter, ATPase component n=1 Tax=Acidilobus saccharovorans (strain DSM 16705 / JCM 18335 / VKM B-2471 / 345-15) TaxID=666510 RepID=D9Q1M5_ACIS3|nr:ABC transporter ATP-binding protein [Acidilobus saccharovorans]ADL19213.1 Dipeptide/oligopeptide ABC transporter, ATPase component [Acidilobus saccharovorans 345-15]